MAPEKSAVGYLANCSEHLRDACHWIYPLAAHRLAFNMLSGRFIILPLLALIVIRSVFAFLKR